MWNFIGQKCIFRGLVMIKFILIRWVICVILPPKVLNFLITLLSSFVKKDQEIPNHVSFEINNNGNTIFPEITKIFQKMKAKLQTTTYPLMREFYHTQRLPYHLHMMHFLKVSPYLLYSSFRPTNQMNLNLDQLGRK